MQALLLEMEAYTISLGACSLGYSRLPAQWVFQNKAALHPNVIVLTMKMDRERINTSPSPEAEYTVLATYRDLGIIANKLADFLRKQGFSAQQDIHGTAELDDHFGWSLASITTRIHIIFFPILMR